MNRMFKITYWGTKIRILWVILLKNFKSMDSVDQDKKKMYYAVFFPIVICLFVLLVFVFERGMGFDFREAGIFPREPRTLVNIFSMPFIHSDWTHLLNNILSFFVLCTSLYYFYSEIANKILVLSVIISGLLLWVIGRDAWHIGLSGIVYSFIFFLFSAVLSENMFRSLPSRWS